MGLRLMFDTERAPQQADATEDTAITAWLIPSLNESNNPGRIIQATMTALLPNGRYGGVYNPQTPPANFKDPVPALPEVPKAAGYRVGAATEMATKIPAEFIVYITGHVINISSLWTYIVVFLTMCMPGAQISPPALPTLLS